MGISYSVAEHIREKKGEQKRRPRKESWLVEALKTSYVENDIKEDKKHLIDT